VDCLCRRRSILRVVPDCPSGINGLTVASPLRLGLSGVYRPTKRRNHEPQVMCQRCCVDAPNPSDGTTDVVFTIHSSDRETSPTIEKDSRACFIGDGHGAAARACVVETHSGLKRLTERQPRVSSLPLFPSLTQLDKDNLSRWMIWFRIP
jgi:hypothetical protein